jgi:DNA-binding protein HU-beta
MNKKDLVKSLSEKVGGTQKDLTVIVEAVVETIKETLAKGEEVALPGLGKFLVKDSAAREVFVNPKQPELGKKVCPASKKVSFKPAKELKEIVK